MQPFVTLSASITWFHVTWATRHRRRTFKIRGLQRFCERVIHQRCAGRTWRIVQVCVTPHRVHVLVKADPGVSRRTMLREVRSSVAAAVESSGVARFLSGPLWDERSWCSALTGPAQVERIRRALMIRAETCGSGMSVRGDQ
ncbi:MAG: transposase [Gemmatimonadota bacterium]|nr:transposase [Gemmatimonadota bacterium]MDH3571844.1 transposase [Gemmatimonadota bacterium]MDH5550539.1 transposase [Gemmatimonadota bacterium]